MFSRLKKEYVDLNTINEHLLYCYNNREIVEREKTSNERFGNKAFIVDKEIQFTLTYKRGSVACTYIFRKDGDSAKQVIDGGEAFRILSQYYKVPRFEDKQILSMSASPILYKNEKYEGTRQQAVGYDMNSAYSYGMLQRMPDTSVPPRQGFIQVGEIGFIETPSEKDSTKMVLKPKFSGYSMWIFPLMDSPFKDFVDTWYGRKLNPELKDKAKNVLNFCVGYLQRVNPFLRAAIIGYCNELIKSLITEDTLYCNTDSIVSKTPMNNLIIGRAIGEWKVEHEGEFAFKGFNYQWDLEPPHYRGKSRRWFKKGWDILKDEIPKEGNLFTFDKKCYKIVLVER